MKREEITNLAINGILEGLENGIKNLRMKRKIFIKHAAALSELYIIADDCRLFPTLYSFSFDTTQLNAKGFTRESNPQLFEYMEKLEGLFPGGVWGVEDSPESTDPYRTYYYRIPHFYFQITVYLDTEAGACQRVVSGVEVKTHSKVVEVTEEVPIYKFVC